MTFFLNKLINVINNSFLPHYFQPLFAVLALLEQFIFGMDVCESVNA